MVPTSISGLAVEHTPSNGCFPSLHSQGEPHCLLPFHEALQDQQVSLTEVTQVNASALGLGACMILCTPSKIRVSVACSPEALLNTSPTGFQSQMFWGLVFLMQSPWVEEPQTPCSSGRTSMMVIFLLFVDHQAESVDPDYTMSPSLLTSHCGSFFKSLVWKTFSSGLCHFHR